MQALGSESGLKPPSAKGEKASLGSWAAGKAGVVAGCTEAWSLQPGS